MEKIAKNHRYPSDLDYYVTFNNAYKPVMLHYDQPLTNDKILSKNSPKLAY